MKLIYAIPLFASIIITGCSDKPTNNTTTNAGSDNKSSTANTSVTYKPYVSPLGDDAPIYKVDMIQYAPYKMRNQSGGADGYDVDLIRAIGEEAGFKIEIHEVAFSDLFIGIKAGTKDLAMSGLSLLPERKKVMLPSKPYLKTTPGYLVKEGSSYKSKEELVDKEIAVLENSAAYTMLKEQGSTNLVLKQNVFASIQALFTDEADAAFAFQVPLLYEAAQFPEHPSKFIANADPIMTVVWGNLEKTDIIDKFNEGFDKVVANGRYKKINEKWFGDSADQMAVK